MKRLFVWNPCRDCPFFVQEYVTFEPVAESVRFRGVPTGIWRLRGAEVVGKMGFCTGISEETWTGANSTMRRVESEIAATE
jgi:hypothetical protein